MELNIEVCRAIAVQYGLPLQFVVKELFVFDVLGQIAGSDSGRKLVFKGGTALNKVYLGKIQRFSEDLDFDLGMEGSGGLDSFCKELAGRISGYEIGEMRRVKGTWQFYCGFVSPIGGKDHVRVDVAAKSIIPEKPVALGVASSSYAQKSVAGVRVYSVEDLTARKLMALVQRAEGKDFYDVYNALPLCGGMDGAIEKMLESEGRKEEAGEFVKRAIERAKKADAKKLRNLTNPFIPVNCRPKDWNMLKNDLIMRLEGLPGNIGK